MIVAPKKPHTMETTIDNPPPLPVLVQHKCFHAWKSGLMTQERERMLLENVSTQVTSWLNAEGVAFRILHVAMAQTALGAYATVWFTPKP